MAETYEDPDATQSHPPVGLADASKAAAKIMFLLDSLSWQKTSVPTHSFRIRILKASLKSNYFCTSGKQQRDSKTSHHSLFFN